VVGKGKVAGNIGKALISNKGSETKDVPSEMFEPHLFDSLVPGLEISPCYSLFVIHLKIPFFFSTSFESL
jgi:hypothetical protein